MKVKMFLHDDYDAVACAIIGTLVFGKVKMEYHNYNTINTRLREFLSEKDYEKYDMVIIADIGMDNEVASMINELSTEEYSHIYLVDHHRSAMEMNKYSWAYVSEYCRDNFIRETSSKECDLPKTCATLELYKFLKNKKSVYQYDADILEQDAVQALIESVRLYDNWYWIKEEADILEKYLPYELNALLYIEGKSKFLKNCVEKIKTENRLYLYDFEKIVLELEASKIKSYIKAKDRAMIKKEVQGYMAGVVFAESYVSELGMHLMEMNPDVDFVAIVHMPHKVSFRTNKPEVDVFEIAKLYGGGGHPQSAGCSLSKELTETFTEGVLSIN